ARSTDDVLEIGFGPGQAIELLAKRSAARFIAGVDPSEVMLAQAAQRNRESIEAKRVELVQATVESLPFDDRRFSKRLAGSNFHVWHSCDAGLDEVYRVLRPGGMLLLGMRRCARRPHFWTSPGVSTREIESDRRLLAARGFQRVRVVDRRLGRRVAFLIA